MTFSVKTEGSDGIKAVMSAISTLVEEATFVANAAGITFRGMDPSHVGLIDILWPSSAFERYECDGDIKFGVSVDELLKLLKRAGKKDDIEISISEKNMLLISMGKDKKYEMRLIESSVTDSPLPKVTFDARIEIDSKMFNRVLGDVRVISDYIVISATKSGATFSGTGNMGKVTVELGADIKSIEVKTDCSGSYSLEYLTPLVKAVGDTAKIITCEYSEEQPLRIEFMIRDVRIHFYLAPSVNN